MIHLQARKDIATTGFVASIVSESGGSARLAMQEWTSRKSSVLWPALVAVVLVAWAAFFAVGMLADPFQPVDRELPDLPAVTLAGQTLDRAFLGDDAWVVTLWLPG
jgi:hypothetical protein